jgi:class 3 adenylate cyclase
LSLPTGPSRTELKRLLRRYNEHPDQRDAALAEIHERFQRRLAVMVIDTCSFSKTVQDRGVVYFLALLERLGRMALPVMPQYGARMLRREAYNFFAVFQDVQNAVTCAATLCRDLEVANRPLPLPDEMHISIGIGYGDMLVIGTHDVFGDEMNLACKLGEDQATEEEVLLTERAHEALEDPHWAFTRTEITHSGMKQVAYKLVLPE